VTSLVEAHRGIGVLLLSLAAAGCGQAAPAAPASAAEEGPASGTGGPTAASAVSEGMVEVEVADVRATPFGGGVVLLRTRGDGGEVVPVFVGETEATAISMRLSRQKYVRPLTHDLFEAVLAEHGIRVVRIEIDDLKENVFLGRLFLVDREGRETRLDARPSDGIALALGAEAPIYVSKSVIERSGEPAREWDVDGASGGPGPADAGPPAGVADPADGRI
jgi:bifunctional DNase/RNase